MRDGFFLFPFVTGIKFFILPEEVGITFYVLPEAVVGGCRIMRICV